MKKILIKIVIMAAIMVPLALAVPAQAASISVGNDTAERAEANGYSNFIVIDTNHPVSANGWLTIFKYYALDQGPFRFILVDGSNKVKWVSEQITPSGTGVNVFTPASAVQVQAGWNLGVYFVETGTIPFEYTGTPAFYTADNSGLPKVGRTLAYAGSVGRTYSFAATGDTLMTTPPKTVRVTVVKYLDSIPASAASANNTYFLMSDSWSDENIGSSGSSRLALGPVGVNTLNPYQATTVSMTSGASYSISEDTSQYAVGTACGNGHAYQLAGYTIGDTLAQAAAATQTAEVSLTGIMSNKFIIVWNNTCAQNQTIVAGNDTKARPVVDNFGDFVIVDTNHPVSANGWLTSFYYYAANRNPFRFVLVDVSDVIQWVSDEIIPPGSGVNTFNPTSPVPVQKGWNVGLYFVSNGTIPYEYTGAPAYYQSNYSGSPLPSVGRTLVYEGSSNRIYSFAATGVTAIPMPETVNVTIVKYLDGTRADAVSANNFSFPMNATWTDPKIEPGSGFGIFSLGPADTDNPNPYQATTPNMTSGASYGVSEDTSKGTVGTTCNNGETYQLVGYTTGDTLAQTVNAQQTTTPPSLSNIVSNKFIIVWNKNCGTGNDDCTYDDNGHHYGNDKGDNHQSPKDKCKRGNNGNHYGQNK